MTAEFRTIGMALEAVSFSHVGKTDDMSALARPPSSSSLSSQIWPVGHEHPGWAVEQACSRAPAGPSRPASGSTQARPSWSSTPAWPSIHRAVCTGRTTDVSQSAWPSSPTIPESVSLTFGLKCPDMTGGPTKCDDEAVSVDVERAPVRRNSPPPGGLEATRSTLVSVARDAQCAGVEPLSDAPLSAGRADALAKLAATPRPKGTTAEPDRWQLEPKPVACAERVITPVLPGPQHIACVRDTSTLRCGKADLVARVTSESSGRPCSR